MAMGADPERGGGRGKSSDDVAVSFLVCLLLLLLLLLFLAWRRLSRNSGGRYHPRRLLRGLMLRWQGLWGEALLEEQQLPGNQDEKLGDEESGKEQLVDVGDEKEQQQLLQGEEEEEEEEEEEKEKQEASKKKADSEPAEDKAVQEASEEEGAPKATESSAGALLSDLHSFSGTAAWEDTGKQLHATAL